MKALIIDQSPTIRTVMKHLLKNEGYECEFATSPEAGIEILDSQGNSIDLVIVDHAAQHIDALNVLKECSEHGYSGKRIVMSQDDRQDMIEKAQELGASCWLHKPVTLDNLQKALTYTKK